MARKPRIEFAGAIYHVINRGYGGQDLFGRPGMAEAFEKLLMEAAERCGWELAAYCILGSRYHLALMTPRGNLVEGVQWLQSTFANRFKGTFHLPGALFERRYRSILVEPGASLANLVHFIHLGPVREGLRSVYNLESYPWNSFSKYLMKSERPARLRCDGWLREVGFSDTAAGWEEYREELAAIAELDAGEREKLFGKLCRGWVVGSKEYRAKVRREFGEMAEAKDWGRRELRALNESGWEELAKRGLAQLGKTGGDISKARKSAEWKAALAWFLKRETSVTNRWLSQRLNMGPDAMVSRLAASFGRLPPDIREPYVERLVEE